MAWEHDTVNALDFVKNLFIGLVLKHYGQRLLLDRSHSGREPGNHIHYIIYLILTFLPQKIPCTFKIDIPDMGHLAGGTDQDVRTRLRLCNAL